MTGTDFTPLIRKAVLADAESFAAVESAAVSHPWNSNQYRESILAHDCWALEVGDDIAGCLVFNKVLDEVELLNIVVAPAYQQRGLGRELMEFLLAASSGQAQKIFLEVRVGNAPAIALYKRLGFAVLGVRKNYYPAGAGREDALVMGLEL